MKFPCLIFSCYTALNSLVVVCLILHQTLRTDNLINHSPQHIPFALSGAYWYLNHPNTINPNLSAYANYTLFPNIINASLEISKLHNSTSSESGIKKYIGAFFIPDNQHFLLYHFPISLTDVA